MTFEEAFEALTDHSPFPWQERLYEEWFAQGQIPPSCNLPTGLGKTSVVAIWLIALANRAKIPRRLVYVVNRRTVVDQTTAETEKLRDNLHKPELAELAERLQGLSAGSYGTPLAISTLRGQFADNREWSADPSRPAVICGTVDMIGSRLLFSGYRLGFKSRPLHAGFLGQDALLIHDEAHLEPAFQKLIETICLEQKRCREFRSLRIMELTATSRTSNGVFGLNQHDHRNTTVNRRIKAKKTIQLHAQADPKKLADQIAGVAMQHKDGGRAILIFVRTVEDVIKVRDKLHRAKQQVEVLTGTLRGKERDGLVEKPVLQRFFPHSDRSENVAPADGTVYLICTSAGEVGVNISADHIVCDLSTFESMVQRFGRVNRFGDWDDTCIDVVYPETFDEKHELTPARQATLRLLEQLNGDASPEALARLDVGQCKSAFSPEPTILPATDILFDAWALTTIRDKMPGRPPVESYLHGLAEWQLPQTQVAWREEVDIVTGTLLEQYSPRDLLDDFPLKPHELLREPSYQAFKHITSLAKCHPHAPAWLLDEQGTVKILTLTELSDKRRKSQIEGCTILLPPSVGGLSQGMFDCTSEQANDVSCGWLDQEGQWRPWVDEVGRPHRIRLWSDDAEHDPKTKGMRQIRRIVFDSPYNDEDTNRRAWDWYEMRALEGGRTAQRPVEFGTHVGDVERWAKQIIAGLSLPHEIAEAIILAARLHDLGKQRLLFQTTLGNHHSDLLLAKSGRKGARLPEPFRHEFASVADAANDAEVQGFSPPMQDLVLHLIAAHHGRARPHFPADEAFDPKPTTDAENLAVEIPRRFARLQRQYGRWGLAYLESLLRAADWAASAEPSEFVAEAEEVSL